MHDDASAPEFRETQSPSTDFLIKPGPANREAARQLRDRIRADHLLTPTLIYSGQSTPSVDEIIKCKARFLWIEAATQSPVAL
jgi:hypothetical protein